MPFVRVPNSALVEVRMSLDSQDVENTLWFESGSAPDASDLSVLAGLIEGWWQDFYAPLVTSTLTLREVVATSMDSATGPQVTVTPATGGVGFLEGSPLPNNVSLTVSFRTVNRGRSFRGRNYVVGMTEEQVDSNTATVTTINAWQDAYEAVGAAVSGSGWTWGVASRFSGVAGTPPLPVPRDPGIITPITAVVIVDATVDSQRRRLPGRGR